MVKGWDHAEVHALCTTNSPRIQVETDVFPPTGPAEKIQLTTQALDPLVTGEEERADYWLDVPMGSSVEIRNRQGGVQVERLTAGTWVESVGGTITATDVAGQLTVRSVGGDIEIIAPPEKYRPIRSPGVSTSFHPQVPSCAVEPLPER